MWAKRRVIYRRDPAEDGDSYGSRNVGVLYATEADAWAACIAEVKEHQAKVLARLMEIAAEKGVT